MNFKFLKVNYKMISRKKPHETIIEKIAGYENVVKFYEKNIDGRFHTKSNLIKILKEINLELNKKQTKENYTKLDSFYNRLGKFI